MQAPQFRRALEASDLSYLDETQRSAVMDNGELRAASMKVLDSKAEDARADAEAARTNAELARAYGLSALAQGAPCDIGQASAVQLRTGSPDRL